MTDKSFIPPANPGLQYRRQQDAIDAAVARVLQSGRYIMGPEVKAFEGEFAAYCGVPHAVGVATGTDAIRLALWALEIGPGAEVIVPAHTAVATVSAVERVGATPVLVDIEPGTYTLDLGSAAHAVGPRTRAVIPVHLYGQPADMDAVLAFAREHDLAVIEDCAQAHGALWRNRRVGSLGTIGCFSFYPTKNLGALGDGGAVVTRDDALAARLRLLREYGWNTRYSSMISGDNSRLDEVQAAVLRVKLEALETDTEERRRIATEYDTRLAGPFRTPTEREWARHVYHLYVVEVEDRNEVQRLLAEKCIGTLVHYPWPIHLQPAYEGRLGRRGQFPVAERTCERVLSLPLYPGLTSGEIERVVNAVKDVMLPSIVHEPDGEAARAR